MVQRLVPFVLLLAACEGGGGGPVPLSELSPVYAEVSCAKIFECCTQEEIVMQFEGLGDPPTNEAECRAFLGGFLSLGTSQLMMSEAAGRIRYDADMAGACADSIRDVSCAEYRGGFSPMGSGATCDAVIVPLVEVGGACSQDQECTTGHCERTGSDDGQCAPLPAMGEDCTFDCVEGLYCGFDGMSRTCQPTKADGEECDGDGECQSERCAGGDPAMGVPGTCSSGDGDGICGG